MKGIISQKSALKELLKRIKKYWFLLAASMIFASVYVVLSLYIPRLIGLGTDQIIARGNVNFQELKNVIVEILVCTAIAAVSWWIMGLCNNRITYNVIRDIRQEAFCTIQKLPVRYMDSRSTGDIVNNVITDVDQLADGLLMGFSNLFTGVLTIFITLVFMIQIQWKIALVVILITPVSFFVAGFIAKRTYYMFRKQSEIRGVQTGIVDEVFSGLKVVKAFGQEENMLRDFDVVNEELCQVGIKATFFSSITNPATRFVNNLVYAAVCVIGAFSVLRRGISVGQISALLSYANQYTKPFNEISGVVTELQNALACAARVFELIEEEPETPDCPDAAVLQPDGSVSLSDVSFSYRPDRKLIEQFNLSVKPGQRVAIVGPTGCGKTTIINLLMRFYDVDAGTIRAAGKDIRNVTRESLRRSYGMVLQDTWLKAGTIRENIAMSKPGATEAEIVAAAKASYAHHFIRQLPKGYDTVITEDGGSLSQGQKQLLCIARVMLNLPPMLILDEATSSIDTRTEMKIQKAFAAMMKGRTSFIVAHRLSTIREADKILVMKDGSVVEKGRHEELLAKNGFYASLYNSQFAR